MKATNKSTSRRAARTPAVVDPIFAAIEAHRTAYARRDAFCNDPTHDDDIPDELSNAEWRTLTQLLAMTPATPAGCAAMLRYVGECGLLHSTVQRLAYSQGTGRNLAHASRRGDRAGGLAWRPISICGGCRRNGS